jgi:hypothetical protein
VTDWATAIEAAKAIAERVAIAIILIRRGLFISVSLLLPYPCLKSGETTFHGDRHARFESGYRKIGDWRLAIGDWRLAIGDWRLAIGDWRLAIGDWRLAILLRVCFFTSIVNYLFQLAIGNLKS